MTQRELKQFIRQIIKQQKYLQKPGYQSTGKDLDTMLQGQIKGALQRFLTKYYYNKDAIAIIGTLNTNIKSFVKTILQKISK